MSLSLRTCLLALLLSLPLLTPICTHAQEPGSPEDLLHGRIAVLTGSAGDLAARTFFPDAEIQQMTLASDAALALQARKIDAFVYDKSVLINLQHNNPDLHILTQPIAQLDIAAVTRKNNQQLMAEVNHILSQLNAEGVLAHLRHKWVDTQYSSPPLIESSLASSTTTEILTLGTAATMEPFAFHANGSLTGLDIELARMIAARLGRSLQIVDMNFEALIPALQSGKIDLALANFNVTEERKQLVLFSQPYISNDISILVRKPSPTAAAPITDVTADLHWSAAIPYLPGIIDSFRSNILEERRYLLIWEGLKVTVIISIFSTLFGTLLGALICYMRMSTSRLLRAPAAIYISIMRGTPVLILLMLIFYVVFASVNISPIIVAIIAFGMNFGAYSSEMFRTGIKAVDPGQTEAGVAMGFSRLQTFIHIVLPQTVHRILPVYKGEFLSLVKMTSIVGYIAVQDLTKASDIIRSRTFDAFFPLIMVAVLYFLISWLLLLSLNHLERATDPHYKRQLKGGRKP